MPCKWWRAPPTAASLMGKIRGSKLSVNFRLFREGETNWYAEGVALGSDGTIYVTDSHNNVIRRVSTDGTKYNKIK